MELRGHRPGSLERFSTFQEGDSIQAARNYDNGSTVLQAVPQGEAVDIVERERCGWVGGPPGDGAALAVEIAQLTAELEKVMQKGNRALQTSLSY